jgi:hypothetical protein
MMTMNDKTQLLVARSLAIVCLIGAMGLLAPLAQAAPSALPPRPVPGPHSTSSRAPTGGYIELDVQLGQSWAAGDVPWQALWTVVQWQDRADEWHDVVGWQGSLDEANSAECKKVWWVAREDLDQGPFRWVVYRRRGGESLAQSESFDLPHKVGETVSVGISLRQ